MRPDSLSRRPAAPLSSSDGEQNMLHRNVLVLEPFGFVFGLDENPIQPARDVDLVRRAPAPAVTLGILLSSSSSLCCTRSAGAPALVSIAGPARHPA